MTSNRGCIEAIRELLLAGANEEQSDRLSPLRRLFRTTLVEDNAKPMTKESLLLLEDQTGQGTTNGESNTKPPPPPHLFVLCRRSDESLPLDGLYEPVDEFKAALGLGGRAMFVQPTPSSGVMHILSDRLPSNPDAAKGALTELLAHEGTHAVDALRHGFDLAMVGPLACSEVRAAYFGECHDSTSLFEWTKRRCVRRMASDSTELAFPGLGSEAVSAVFDWCYKTDLKDNAVMSSPLRQLTAAASAGTERGLQ